MAHRLRTTALPFSWLRSNLPNPSTSSLPAVISLFFFSFLKCDFTFQNMKNEQEEGWKKGWGTKCQSIQSYFQGRGCLEIGALKGHNAQDSQCVLVSLPGREKGECGGGRFAPRLGPWRPCASPRVPQARPLSFERPSAPWSSPAGGRRSYILGPRWR